MPVLPACVVPTYPGPSWRHDQPRARQLGPLESDGRATFFSSLTEG